MILKMDQSIEAESIKLVPRIQRLLWHPHIINAHGHTEEIRRIEYFMYFAEYQPDVACKIYDETKKKVEKYERKIDILGLQDQYLWWFKVED